jgi:HD-GYP domain-containing protein (c-di-GMP phosphodiesterase class II)
LVLLRVDTSLDVRWFSAYGHLVVVSAIAACALLIAAVASATAVRTRKAAVVWLGCGCMVVGIAMLGHGLTTPGVWGRGPNVWVGRLPYLAMASLSLGLAGASTSPSRRLNRLIARHPLAAIAVPACPTAALTIAVVADSQLLSGTAPLPHEGLVFDVLSLVSGALLLPVIATHWRRWQLGHDIVQLAIVFASAMCIAALTAFELGVFAQLSWWDYHAYLLAGFGMTAFAVLARGRRAQAVTEVLAETFNDDPFAAIVSGYPEALRSMVRAVEIKDAYTHGHSARTALTAVELGQRMRLSPDRLRIIARGAYLHDLGKIGIPDQILNKPGRLTPEERAIIETHPQLGYEIASAASSLREALPVILHHHERLDGAGYPAGLAGHQVPIEARVVAVADVWDALTSRRAYRDPMAREDALAHIVAGSGTHFDPAVVEALAAHLHETEGITTGANGTPDEAWEAAQTCHELDRDHEPATA